MTHQILDEAARLIDDFLFENPDPTIQDWKRLIDANPQHATAIAESAIAHGASDSDEVNENISFNEKAFNATISQVLNRVHEASSPVLELANQKVESIKGPVARRVAQEIGIGDHVVLLNGILAGRTRPPKKVLEALRDRLDVPVAALSELFQRAFVNSAIPAFRSSSGNPKLQTKPRTWEEAVQAMNLPVEETRRLLQLSEEK